MNKAGDAEKLREFYNSKLPDIDLIYFKEECTNLPYERFGRQVVDIFRENFKIVKLFLAKISCLIFSHEYFKQLGEDLAGIPDSIARIREHIDVTKLLCKRSETD